jgi:DNA-binding FadR family transcriptional regulator
MLPKVTRGTLAEQVTLRLMEFIESQSLKPGDLLPSETSLANSFGVSRPVIREALKNLEGKGVLEIVNGKGAMIRPVDSDPLRLFFQRAMQTERGTLLELMEVRKGLEVQAAVLAAERRGEGDLQAIRQVVQAMAQNMEDFEAYTRLDVEFHMCIASASHNAMLVYLVESIRDALRNTIVTGLRSRGPMPHIETIQQSHEALLQTITDQDVEASRLAMIRHFDDAIDAITNPRG